jgi:hypothetical protein
MMMGGARGSPLAKEPTLYQLGDFILGGAIASGRTMQRKPT